MKIPEPRTLDGYVLTVIFEAMASGTKIRVNGKLTNTAIRNFYHLGEAWQNMNPALYKPIEIEADEILDANSIVATTEVQGGMEKAVLAFSGGLDCHFTAMRHSRKYLNSNLVEFGGLPPSSQPFDLTRAIMVHGFDVRFENTRDFSILRKRVEGSLSHLQLELSTVRTNIRVAETENWEHTHGAKISSVLNQYSSLAKFGVIASGSPYSKPIVSWGSAPSLDHLYSGGEMTIFHDGAGFSRQEKTALIVRAPELVRRIKVCWQGEKQGENCGSCEKCVRTRLNFMASGLPNPECFTSEFSEDIIDNIHVTNDVQLRNLESILDYLGKNNKNVPDWAKKLKQKINHSKKILHRSGNYSSGESIELRLRKLLQRIFPKRN